MHFRINSIINKVDSLGINLGEGPDYSFHAEDCLLFSTDFCVAYFPYSFAAIATKLHMNFTNGRTWSQFVANCRK